MTSVLGTIIVMILFYFVCFYYYKHVILLFDLLRVLLHTLWLRWWEHAPTQARLITIFLTVEFFPVTLKLLVKSLSVTNLMILSGVLYSTAVYASVWNRRRCMPQRGTLCHHICRAWCAPPQNFYDQGSTSSLPGWVRHGRTKSGTTRCWFQRRINLHWFWCWNVQLNVDLKWNSLYRF